MSSQTELQTRSTILAYFDADPEQYMVVFTSNASGALKLVAEAYPFGPSNRLILGEDSHNSLHGMRMFSAKANARTDYFNVLDSGLIDTESFEVCCCTIFIRADVKIEIRLQIVYISCSK